MTNLSRPATTKPHLFVVDNEEDTVFTMGLLLKRQGYQVSSYYDGPSALAAAEELRPDAILLDIGMSPMDGYEVCRRLRSAAWGHLIAIIALTGYGRPVDIQRVYKEGFDGYVLKPVSFAEIMKVVTSCVTNRRAA